MFFLKTCNQTHTAHWHRASARPFELKRLPETAVHAGIYDLRSNQTQAGACTCVKSWGISRNIIIYANISCGRENLSCSVLPWAGDLVRVLKSLNATTSLPSSFSRCFEVVFFFHVCLLAAGSSCLKRVLETSPSTSPIFLSLSPCQRWPSTPFGGPSFGQRELCRPAQAVGTSRWGQAEAGADSPIGPPSLENVFNANWSLREKVLKWWPRKWNNLLIGKWRVSICIF